VKLRPLAAGAVLAAVALFGSACGGEDTPSPNDPAGSSGAEQPADTAARDELKAALEKSALETSLKMTITMSGGTIEAHIDTAAKTSLMKMDMEASGESMKMEMITIGADTYVKYLSGGIADQVKGKWVKVDTATLGQDDVFAGEFFDADALLTDGATVSELAEGRYRVELAAGEGPDVGGLFGGLTGGGDEPDPSASGGPTSVVITVGADGLVSGFEAEGATPEESATVTVGDYGVPVKVEKPADKDVIEG